MSLQHTTQGELNGSQDNTLDLDHEAHTQKRGLFAMVKEDVYTSTDISHAELRVYLLIASYCGSHGVCYANPDTFSEKYKGMDPKTLRTHCQSLEKKGFLFRKQIPSVYKGSKRVLVVQCHAHHYFSYLLSKNRLKEAADIEAYFSGLDPEYCLKKLQYERKASKRKHKPQMSSSGGDKEDMAERPKTLIGDQQSGRRPAAPERPKTGRSYIKYTTYPYRENNDVDDLDAVVGLDKKEEELKKAGIDGELLKVTMAYADTNHATLSKKDNPIGYLIWAAKSGLCMDAHQEQKTLQAQALNQASQKEARRKQAQELKRKAEEGGSYGITYDEHSITLRSIGHAKGLAFSVGFDDPNYEKLTQTIERRLHEHIQTAL